MLPYQVGQLDSKKLRSGCPVTQALMSALGRKQALLKSGQVGFYALISQVKRSFTSSELRSNDLATESYPLWVGSGLFRPTCKRCLISTV